MGLGGLFTNAPSSGPTDQQGWWVTQKVINVTTSAITLKIIGFEQTADNKIKMEIVANNAGIDPLSVSIAYWAKGQFFTFATPLTKYNSKYGEFYYSEFNNGDEGLAIGDIVDYQITMKTSSVPYGAISSPRYSYSIQSQKINIEVSDAGKGYLKFKGYSELSASASSVRFANLEIQNNLFCWQKIQASNGVTGIRLTGHPYWSHPTWLQFGANAALTGGDTGPFYVQPSKVNLLNIVSIDTLFGKPDIYDFGKTTLLPNKQGWISQSHELSAYHPLTISGDKGNPLTSLDLFALNLVDTVWDFIGPILFDDGDSDEEKMILSRRTVELMLSKIRKTPSLQQKIAAALAGDASMVPEIIKDALDVLIDEFIGAEELLYQLFIADNMDPAKALRKAKNIVKKIEATQFVGNNIAKFVCYTLFPQNDEIILRAIPRGINFDTKQVSCLNATSMVFRLGSKTFTNETK